MHAAWIHTGEETSPARRADWALAICAGEGKTRIYEAVDVGCADMHIAKRIDGIKALLIGADPEDIGPRSNRRF